MFSFMNAMSSDPSGYVIEYCASGPDHRLLFYCFDFDRDCFFRVVAITLSIKREGMMLKICTTIKIKTPTRTDKRETRRATISSPMVKSIRNLIRRTILSPASVTTSVFLLVAYHQ